MNGGNGQVALSSAEALAKFGVNTILFAAAGPIAPGLRDVAGLSVTCLDQSPFLENSNIFSGAVSGLWNASAARALRAVLKNLDPADTIVHIHSWTKALSSSVAREAISAGFSLVMTIHDYFAFCPNGSLYDHSTQSPCLLTPMSLACAMANCDPRSRAQKAYRVARQLVTDRIAGIPREVDNFIFVSSFSREIAEPHLKGGRMFEVANPIATEPGNQVNVAENSDFLYLGRLSREKGPDVLAHAGKSAQCELVFVGDGPLEAELRRTAPNADFPGWLDREGVRSRLGRARALVLPSRWYEASPLVVPEAASLGVPSIVSDGCAASESIVDGVTGLRFKNGDIADLGAKLTQLKDPSLAAKLGAAAYEQFWTAPPLMPQHIADLLAVYNSILLEREGKASSR